MNAKFVLIALLALSGIARGQEARSYYIEASGNGQVIELVASVGASGFVITDVIYPVESATRTLRIAEVSGGETTSVLAVTNRAGNESHLESGVPIAPNSGISLLMPMGGEVWYITVSGYVPDLTQGGTVPAVSTWGLATLALLLLTGGSLLALANRKTCEA